MPPGVVGRKFDFKLSNGFGKSTKHVISYVQQSRLALTFATRSTQRLGYPQKLLLVRVSCHNENLS